MRCKAADFGEYNVVLDKRYSLGVASSVSNQQLLTLKYGKKCAATTGVGHRLQTANRLVFVFGLRNIKALPEASHQTGHSRRSAKAVFPIRGISTSTIS